MMVRSRFFPVIIAALMLSATAHAELAARLFINGQQAEAQPGRAELWELEIYDTDTGIRVTDFVATHMKFMHLVVMRDDLSEFAHFHPFYDASTGLFQTIVNLPTVNPDNQAATHAVPRPGHYLAFAEVKSKSLGLKGFRIPFTAVGEDRSLPLEADAVDSNGEVIKYFVADGSPSEAGAEYRARFSYVTVPGEGGDLIRFFVTFEVRGEGGSYSQIDRFQPWLMMGGHSILTSQSRGDDRLYGHLHSALPEDGGLLTFSYYNRGKVLEELNKIWFQFRHHDVVYTAPFVFDYKR